MNVIRFDIPDEVADLLGDSPEQVNRRALEIIVLQLYRRHDVSAGRAAEILGIEKWTFIRWAGELGIPYLDTDPEDWEHRLRALEEMERLDSES
jgi:hypothetical protein